MADYSTPLNRALPLCSTLGIIICCAVLWGHHSALSIIICCAVLTSISRVAPRSQCISKVAAAASATLDRAALGGEVSPPHSPRGSKSGKRRKEQSNEGTATGNKAGGKGGPGSPRKQTDPWDVEIGLSVTHERVVIIETSTHIQLGNGPDVSKQDLAEIVGCGPNDKCWAVALSAKPWPFKLHLCNHKDDEGHESWDSDSHVFTPAIIRRIKDFVNSLAHALAPPSGAAKK